MRISKEKHNFSLLIILFCSWLCKSYAQNQSGIGISKQYPQYFTYRGKEVLLLGGSDEDNLFQMPDLEKHLNILKASGGNYVRCTMSSRDQGNEWPFGYDEAKEKYNLKKFNEVYWKRFEDFLSMTSERQIFVQIELWATFDFYRNPWQKNPFNPKNNTNYSSSDSEIAENIPTHPTRTDNNFFRTTPYDVNVNYRVLTYQQKFIDKILEHSLKYDHILYCMDNETSVSAQWGRFWSLYIKEKAAEQGKRLLTTEMWDPWDLNHVAHRESFFHPEIYDFVEISQNNHNKREMHWQQGIYQIQRLKNKNCLRPVTNIKIYGAQGGRHGGDNQDAIEKFIRNILMGCASARFHRPSSGIGLKDTAQAVIKSMRMLSEKVTIFKAIPDNSLLLDHSENEAYCMVSKGDFYIIYFPDTGEVRLDIAESNNYNLVWLNVLENRWGETKKIKTNTILLKNKEKNQIALIYTE